MSGPLSTLGERRLLDECVHCGFCLPACPTYQNAGQEMDSPRGRIYLMRQVDDGHIPLTDEVIEHFDRCLGCMACMTACPSGVKYDALIEQTRVEVDRRRPRPLLERLSRGLLFALFPHPGRLRVLAALQIAYEQSGLRAVLHATRLIRLLPRRLRLAEALMPAMSRRTLAVQLPAVTPATGARRARVALLAGCVQRVYFPEVNVATVAVLSAEGCEVVVPEGAGCCGALSHHAGRSDEARALARALIEKVEAAGAEYLVVNSAGCGSAIKDYRRLFHDDPEWLGRAVAVADRCRDACELLRDLGPVAERHPVPARAAWHDPCHLQHAQRCGSAGRALLAQVPGLTLVDVPEGEQCCGSAGVYNLLQPESSRQVGARKVDNVLATRADLLVSANPGCTLQIQGLLRERGQPLRAAHPLQILAASLRVGRLD